MQNLEYIKIKQFLVHLFDQDLLSSSYYYLAEPQLYENQMQDVKYYDFLSFVDQYQQEHGRQYIPIQQQQQSLILKEKQDITKNAYLNSRTYAWIGSKKKKQKSKKNSVNITNQTQFTNKQVIYQSLQLYGEQQFKSSSRNTSSKKQEQQGTNTVNQTIKLSGMLKTPNFKQIEGMKIMKEEPMPEIQLNNARNSLVKQRIFKKQRSFSESDNLATHQVIINTINDINQLKQKLETPSKFDSSRESETKSFKNDFPQRLSFVPPARIDINVSKFKGCK